MVGGADSPDRDDGAGRRDRRLEDESRRGGRHRGGARRCRPGVHRPPLDTTHHTMTSQPTRATDGTGRALWPNGRWGRWALHGRGCYVWWQVLRRSVAEQPARPGEAQDDPAGHEALGLGATIVSHVRPSTVTAPAAPLRGTRRRRTATVAPLTTGAAHGAALPVIRDAPSGRSGLLGDGGGARVPTRSGAPAEQYVCASPASVTLRRIAWKSCLHFAS
jgi:hypothetical protein